MGPIASGEEGQFADHGHGFCQGLTEIGKYSIRQQRQVTTSLLHWVLPTSVNAAEVLCPARTNRILRDSYLIMGSCCSECTAGMYISNSNFCSNNLEPSSYILKLLGTYLCEGR
jgi:hypothetical protein